MDDTTIIKDMEKYINALFLNTDLEGCVVEYYPHIENISSKCGNIRDEKPYLDKDENNIKLSHLQCSESEYTEYIHGWKIMNIYESGIHEYKYIQQKYTDIHDGLYVVSKIDYIEPNKFPILSKYYDIRHKKTKTYHDKYFDISYIKEERKDEMSEEKVNKIYLKLIFEINTKYQKNIIRHITSIISLLQ
jgi:hypothetical protein